MPRVSMCKEWVSGIILKRNKHTRWSEAKRRSKRIKRRVEGRLQSWMVERAKEKQNQKWFSHGVSRKDKNPMEKSRKKIHRESCTTGGNNFSSPSQSSVAERASEEGKINREKTSLRQCLMCWIIGIDFRPFSSSLRIQLIEERDILSV